MWCCFTNNLALCNKLMGLFQFMLLYRSGQWRSLLRFMKKNQVITSSICFGEAENSLDSYVSYCHARERGLGWYERLETKVQGFALSTIDPHCRFWLLFNKTRCFWSLFSHFSVTNVSVPEDNVFIIFSLAVPSSKKFWFTEVRKSETGINRMLVLTHEDFGQINQNTNR